MIRCGYLRMGYVARLLPFIKDNDFFSFQIRKEPLSASKCPDVLSSRNISASCHGDHTSKLSERNQIKTVAVPIGQTLTSTSNIYNSFCTGPAVCLELTLGKINATCFMYRHLPFDVEIFSDLKWIWAVGILHFDAFLTLSPTINFQIFISYSSSYNLIICSFFLSCSHS